ncbi:MAG: toprim domain-containing protein [Gammaproteobacteria bacterium]|nr:toprim domain-containing protein [Gammaproteobacteria bacterium]MBU1507281.1 toprim domain-containing protein [Gammaproteobacteria bacterium]MBU2120884.1 toprim domain-containing protein [Gammaproteobacteria bacterium]MBU2169599.1 toprim domain-containing protein [Gammaproteobacteria bacterium]MBU2201730.1 toprim domain-containing protein [Gammaproteobacteria bacterium]
MSAAGARHAYEVNRARIASLWAEARPVSADDAAGRYLARSGVANGTSPAALRLHPALDYWHMQADRKPVCLGRFPALLALFEVDTYPRGLHGAPVPHAVALQRIYLAADGSLAPVPAPIKLTGKAGPALGACARLAHADSTSRVMGMAVGISTALRIARAARMPVWAVPDAALLAHARWPRGLRHLHVFVDARDPDQWRSAAELARKASACGLQVFPMVADMASSPQITATRL